MTPGIPPGLPASAHSTQQKTMPIITGTDNPDVLVGTLGDDTIVGMSGDDSILAGRGDNIIFGNQGNDILRAGRGQDTLLGGRDNDQLFGNEQDNILSGDVGDDTLFAVDGENILFGNDGSDVLVGGLGNDFLYGGQGDDTIWAERGNNLVSGDRGADVLIGGTGENIFVVNINQGGPNIEDAEQILRFKSNDKIALLGGPEGQTVDESAINIAFVRREANSTRGDFVLTNLATGEFLAVIRNVRRSTLTDDSFTEDLTLSDTPDPGPPQPPVTDPDDELPPAPDPGDTTTDPQPPPTDGPGTPPVIEPPVDEEPGEGEPGDGDDPGTGTGDNPDDPTNNSPEAQNSTGEVNEDGPAIEIDVLGNDSDPDGDLLKIDSFQGVTSGVTVTISGDPPEGSVAGNQKLTYDPGAAFQSLKTGETGSDNFTYTISDGRGGTATAEVTVTIVGADDLPTSQDDSVEVPSGESFSFSADDFVFNDPDAGDEFQAIKLISIPGDGTLTFEGTAVSINEIIPVANFDSLVFTQGTLDIGDDTSFDFEVQNTRDVLSDESYTMTLDIEANPNAPKIDLDGDEATGIIEELNRDYIEGEEGNITELSFANDVRFDLPAGNSLSEVVVTLTNGIQDVNEVLSLSPIAGIDIGVSGDETTEVTLTNGGAASVADFQTLLQQITYKNAGADADNPTEGVRTVTLSATDDSGLESNPSKVNIDVKAFNDPPQIHESGVFGAATTGGSYDLKQLFTAAPFSDLDAGSQDVEVTFSVEADAGGEFDYTGSTLTGKLAGLNSNSLTITAPISEINTAIADGDLQYIPSVTSDFDLLVKIDDDGNSGSVGYDDAQQADQTFTIPIQNLAGISEMTITNIDFGKTDFADPNTRFFDIPASAFLSVGTGNDVKVTDLKSFVNLESAGDAPRIQVVGSDDELIRIGSIKDIADDRGDLTGSFEYSLEVDGASVETSQTVEITYIVSNDSDQGPEVLTGGDGPDILYGRTKDNTLIGGPGDDVLVGALKSNILYGGLGNDTLTGPFNGDNASDDDNDPDTFVFNKDDIIARPGFNADSITKIREHGEKYGDVILSFNWDDSGNTKKDWSLFNSNHDVIQLSGFGIDDTVTDFDFREHMNEAVLTEGELSTNPLSSGQNFFLVIDGLNPEDNSYLLYDATGNPTQDEDTYIVAKLFGNSIAPSANSPSGNFSNSDFKFTPLPYTP
ncbi:MAG: Ig-like domain-containing protein [Phormidium sp.]